MTPRDPILSWPATAHSSGGYPHHDTRNSFDDDLESELEKAGYVENNTFENLPLRVRIVLGFLFLTLALVSLYAFMVAIQLLGESFTLLFACNTKSVFEFADNPVAGLMVGIVSTAMLHSSSTVTAVMVALVGSGGLTVRSAIPIIMGANIGTSVTCIMVAFAQISKRDQFERAMAASSVHDMYNIWSVLVMFPLELLFHPLEKLSEACVGGKTNFYFDSPIDIAVKPFADVVLNVNRTALYGVASGSLECGQVNMVDSGVFKSASASHSLSDSAIGGICLGIAFALLVASLVCLVQSLTKLVGGSARKYMRHALNYSGYLNIFIGIAVTFGVQSSTIVTSTLTPLAGLDLITLDQVYPLIIGANVGTTVKALLASWVTGTYNAVMAALVHLFFNIFGIFFFYVIPAMRYPILHSAERIGYYSARWPLVALLFLLMVFFVVPGAGFGMVYLYKGNATAVGFGISITAIVGVLVVAIYWWYWRRDGRERWHYFLAVKAEDHRMRMEAVRRARDDDLAYIP